MSARLYILTRRALRNADRDERSANEALAAGVQECPPCTSDCAQGRQCPVRQACERPEPDAEPSPFDRLLRAAQQCAGWVLFFGVVGAIAVAVWPRGVA